MKFIQAKIAQIQFGKYELTKNGNVSQKNKDRWKKQNLDQIYKKFKVNPEKQEQKRVNKNNRSLNIIQSRINTFKEKQQSPLSQKFKQIKSDIN